MLPSAGRIKKGIFIFLFLAVWTPIASGVISFDNVGSASSSSGGTTISWSHTIGSGDDRMLIVGVGAEDDSSSDLVISSVTYNGVEMLPVAGSSCSVGTSTLQKTDLYYQLDSSLPSAGTYTIIITYAGSINEINGGAISLAGVAQLAREAVETNSNTGSDTISTNITTLTSGAWVVDVVGSGNGGSFSTTTSGMNERWDTTIGSSSAAASTRSVSTAGMVTMSWTGPGNRNAHSVAAFAAAEEGPQPPNYDLNGDWSVDWTDFDLFADQWLAPAGCPGPTCADFDSSGNVNFTDYVMLLNNWTGPPQPTQALINELMAANSSVIADGYGDYDDWIEIYNPGTESIDIGGMFITDDLNEPDKWQIPGDAPTQTTIPGHGHLVLWADDETSEGPLHVGFKLDKDGEAVGLYGSNLTLVDSIEFGEQYTDVSYGPYPDGTESWQYMGAPTPGAQNTQGYLGLVDEVDISHGRGFYDSPFTVELFCEDDDATIKYTLNGDTPTDTVGLTYNPTTRIDVTGTTCLRTAAFRAGYKSSVVNTATYIFLDEVKTQDNSYAYSKGFPTTWAAGYADYEMDPDVLGNPGWSSRFETAMTAIPTISLVTDMKYLFDSTIGIYVNNWEGIENPASIEYFDPCTGDDFQVNAGLRMVGNQSQGPEYTSKHSLRIFFKSEFGPPEFETSALYQGIGAKRLNNISLRSDYHYGWMDSTHQSAVPMASYLRDSFAQDSLRDMGWLSPYSRQVHVYINGLYWGIYQASERSDGPFLAEHIGGEREEYDAVEGADSGTELKEGQLASWDYMYSLISGYSYSTPVGASVYSELAQYIDTTELCDYIIYNTFVASWDWSSKNWYAGSQRNPLDASGPPLGKWIFYSWDSESCMDDPYTGQGYPFSGYTAGPPCVMHNCVHQNPVYKRLLADRVHKHLFNNGALTQTSNTIRWENRAELIEDAIIGESARWGDFLRDTKGLSSYDLYTPTYWDNERDRMINPSHTGLTDPYFPNRTNHMLTYRYLDYGFYPDVAAPSFSQFGGEISAGGSVTITGGGTIYYTTDGSEPADYGTTISSGSSVTINNSLTLKARADYGGGDWSALNEAAFAVGPVKENLRITEIMYHPVEPGDPCQEFVELKNIGTSTINLNLVKFSEGVHFTFPNMTLAAGQHVLVVHNQSAFEDKYGTGLNIAGEYTGPYSGVLSNAGERIRLEDAIGRTILDFSYKDGWRKVTDGEGFSLNIFDENAEPNTWDDKANWCASKYPGGTPDADDNGLLKEHSIAVNEMLAHSDTYPGDWIELKNTTTSSIDIGGWYLSDDDENLTKYRIKPGTVLAPGAYLVLSADANFGPASTDTGKTTAFAFSEYGETAYLASSDGGQLTGYREQEDFDASENNVAFGRYQKSTGTYNFVAMSTNTPGADNVYPKVGPVVINEIMYSPASGGQNEEYIELHNITGSTVNLYDVNGVGWKFTDGIKYTFPAVTIPGNGYLLLVHTTPAYFITKYSVPGGVTVLGPYNGWLSNSGEKLEISKPTDTDELGQTVYVRVDRVVYSDGSHPDDEGVDLWPKAADAGGKSLSRKVPTSYGNDIDNWEAANPSPGSANP